MKDRKLWSVGYLEGHYIKKISVPLVVEEQGRFVISVRSTEFCPSADTEENYWEKEENVISIYGYRKWML